ncbi:hypothetical protein D3260_05590 [Salinisphaera sp. Q1T1-3]|nr:hypothetical protein D3260_05590 [Salinisphaera sp. Q1T1-3]
MSSRAAARTQPLRTRDCLPPAPPRGPLLPQPLETHKQNRSHTRHPARSGHATIRFRRALRGRQRHRAPREPDQGAARPDTRGFSGPPSG